MLQSKVMKSRFSSFHGDDEKGQSAMQVLRDSLQCSLPIEVVYSSDQDMSADWKQKLEVRLKTLGVSTTAVHWLRSCSCTAYRPDCIRSLLATPMRPNLAEMASSVAQTSKQRWTAHAWIQLTE